MSIRRLCSEVLALIAVFGSAGCSSDTPQAAAPAPIGYHLARSLPGFSAPKSLISDFIPATAIPFSDHGQTAGFVVTDISPGAFARPSKTNNTAAVYSARSLVPPYAPVSTITGVPDGAIAVGDLNADGRTEMVVVTAAEILVYRLDRKTRSRPVQAGKLQYPLPGYITRPQRAILQDLNGDGKPELIVGDGYSQALQVYMNTSAGTFSFAAPVNIPWCPKGSMPLIIKTIPLLSLELVSADMNADGKTDLVVSGYCGLAVILNRTPDHGPIAFDAPVPVMNTAGESPRQYRSIHVALADVNRDGKTDIIVAENGYGMRGGEASTLDVLVNETGSSPSFRLAQHLQIGKRVASVVSGDFNQDGWADIATIDATDGTLTFLLNDGQWKSKGAFVLHSSFTVMPEPQQLLVIDRPGGGLPRLLLRNSNSAAMVQ